MESEPINFHGDPDRELKSIIRSCYSNADGPAVSEEEIDRIYDTLIEEKGISIKDPEYEFTNRMNWIASFKIPGGGHEYKSLKPGNITLNMRKAICSIPSMVLDASYFYSEKRLMIVCAVISICQKLRSAFTVAVTEEQALVLSVLWKNCPEKPYVIDLDKGFKLVNEALAANGREKLSYSDYNHIVNCLLKFKCLDITENRISLKERIIRKYE